MRALQSNPMTPISLTISQRPRDAVALAALAGVSLLSLVVGVTAQEATSPRRGVSNPPAEATVQLQELNVQGSGRGVGNGGDAGSVVRAVESPTGPVSGYVATRSATATKTNTPLIETPQSISVVGREQIDAQKAQTLTQATQYVPGLFSGSFGADSRIDYFNLRGFVASDYGLYRDGLQLLNYGFGYFKVDTFGLERIEILRGPAAVLFGAGTPGGLINQVSKRPTLDAQRYIEVGGGSFGQGYAAFDLSGPADDSGHWFYRLTGIGHTGGTQVDGAPDDRVYIAPAFTYKPDGATKFTFLSSYQHDNTAVTSNFLPYSGTVRPNLGGLRIPRSLNVGDIGLNTFRRDQAFVGYEFEHAFDETWTIRQNLRYSFLESFQNSYIGQLGYSDPATETRLARYQFRDSARVNLFQVDNQAEARFFDGFFRHDLLMGIDYKNYQLHDNQASTFPGPDINIRFPAYGQRVSSPVPYLVNADTFEQTGLYAQDQIKLTDRLTLVVGGRQDFADNLVRDRINPANTNGRSDNAFTYRTALIYNYDFGLAPYISYSTSFQPQIGSDANNIAFKPETGNQIEGGVKFEPPGAGYFLTLAGFDIHRSNVLTPVPGTFFQSQIGQVRSTGFEAQFTASLAEGLNAVAAFTVFGLTVERSADPATIGKVPVAQPDNFASLFLDYTIPVGDFRGFGFGGGVRYFGRSYADTLNTFRVPDYVLFDAQVHYNWENWRFAVNATNIGDRRFVSSCNAVNSCFYGDARRVIASLAYKW